MGIKEVIQQMIRDTFFYDLFRSVVYYIELTYWKVKGKPIPPPNSIKIKTIKKYAKLFSGKTFIETGTFLGDTVAAVKGSFKKVFSIEIDMATYEKAKNRFIRFPNIKILQGDSGILLPKILSDIPGRCLFWLDGHYCWGVMPKEIRECPIRAELEAILNRKFDGDVVLIDDARFYVGKGEWPHIEELKKLVFNFDPALVFEVKDDIIRIHR